MRPGLSITSIATIFASVIVNATSEIGPPSVAWTTPTAPLIKAGSATWANPAQESHDLALDWNGGRPAPAEGRRVGPSTPAASGPGRPPLGRRELGWLRRRGRRLPIFGSALAVAAAVGIVVVARPWAGVPAGLPPNSVSLIDPGGGGPARR
jgi:hypothetical protein